MSGVVVAAAIITPSHRRAGGTALKYHHCRRRRSPGQTTPLQAAGRPADRAHHTHTHSGWRADAKSVYTQKWGGGDNCCRCRRVSLLLRAREKERERERESARHRRSCRGGGTTVAAEGRVATACGPHPHPAPTPHLGVTLRESRRHGSHAGCQLRGGGSRPTGPGARARAAAK